MRYFTGKMCRNGHVAERLTCNSDCLECLAARSRHQRANAPERKAATNARYYSKNKELVLSINASWRANNITRMRSIRRAHYMANKSAYYVASGLRKRRVMQATPSWVDREAIRKVYREANTLTATTGIKHDVDHVMPLNGRGFCGLHVPWNIQALPTSINRAKGNRVILK